MQRSYNHSTIVAGSYDLDLMHSRTIVKAGTEGRVNGHFLEKMRGHYFTHQCVFRKTRHRVSHIHSEGIHGIFIILSDQKKILDMVWIVFDKDTQPRRRRVRHCNCPTMSVISTVIFWWLYDDIKNWSSIRYDFLNSIQSDLKQTILSRKGQKFSKSHENISWRAELQSSPHGWFSCREISELFKMRDTKIQSQLD